jgi:hypothetical protein
MATLIDLECRFRDYLGTYRQKHDIDEDVLEEIAPELYLRWLDLPMTELGGKSPNAYFESFSGGDLVTLLGQYFFSELQIPGALLGRIVDTKEETYAFVNTMLQNYEGEHGDEFKTILLELIEEMEMPHPYAYYIGEIEAAEEGNDFTEACVDALKGSGDTVKEILVEAYERAEAEYARECFLDILSDLPYDERVFAHVLDKFIYSVDRRAFYASCLGKLCNDKALPYLEDALRQEGLSYFDYVSIRNAVEELGGEVNIERDFEGDKDYDALSDLEEK